MHKKNKIAVAGQGFTIVELMVASAVFATVLLVALTGFLQIGRLFYKGISATQTQDATRQVVNDISNNLKATPGTTVVSQNLATPTQPYSYFCAGAYRYTYGNYMNGGSQNGKPLQYISSQNVNYDPTSTSSSNPPNMGLVKDRVGAGSCPAPCASGSTNSATKCPGTTRVGIGSLGTATELLGNGMRIGQLTLTQVPSTNLYNLNVAVVFGDYTLLDYSTTPPTCTGGSRDQKFCAVDQLSTSIFEGELHP